MSQSGIKSEDFVHDVTKNTEKAMMIMQPQISPDQQEKQFQKYSEVDATQKKLYVNSIRIATTLAAAINSKPSSYINKNWSCSDIRNLEEQPNCDNDEFNEDIDIDGYDTHQSDEEIDSRQHKEDHTTSEPSNIGPNHTVNSPCKDLDSSELMERRNLFLNSTNGCLTTAASRASNILSSFGNSFNNNVL